MSQSPIPQAVEEFHGPYGPYQVSEIVLQKIWLELAFDTSRLVDQFGRKIEIVDRGIWNRLEGPDFKDAVIRFDGKECRGDVEVHFSQSDWRTHQHDEDPAYDRVILHVLYYTPPADAKSSVTSSGKELARVSLLPLLWYSLEEYAGEDSLIASTGVDLRPEVESLLREPLEGRKLILVRYARKRWEMKCHFAQRRLERLGWGGACHQTVLEVLGFARNRVPMLMIAEAHSLEDFAKLKKDIEELMSIGEGRWRLNACRPANLPRIRLQQYIELVRNNPQWPDQLDRLSSEVEQFSVDPTSKDWGTATARALLEVSETRKLLSNKVLKDKIRGPKSDTLICDGLLPLLSAHSGADYFSSWFHWNAGNTPDCCVEALRTIQVLEPRKVPMSNGWLQGILGFKNSAERDEDGNLRFQAHA